MTETDVATPPVASTNIVSPSLASLPALGQPFAAGLFAGITTTKDGRHCAVVLPADRPSGRLHWQAATDWAKSLEADLPTRPVAAMLFANVPGEFEKGWHWTADVYDGDGSYAWTQYFDYGYQYDSHKSYEGRARAVRLIHLAA